MASSVRSWVSGQPWVGRAGPTDKAVLIAHCTLAERAAREVYAADVRTLAELAGVSKSAVSLANGRLVAAGYLTLVAPSETVKGLAARYELRLKWTVNQDTDSLTSSRAAESEVARGSTLEARAAALWARAALGPIAGEVYRALQTGAQTLPALIAATGRGRRSVQRALSVLAAHGLAVRVGRVWSVGAADPATVAETTAANARAALRSAWHEREREAWREAQR